MLLLTPVSTLFPYTTLFRSRLFQFRYELCISWIRLPLCSTLLADHSFAWDWLCFCVYSTQKEERDRKSTRLNSSHITISYAVFFLKKKRLLIVVLDFEHSSV